MHLLTRRTLAIMTAVAAAVTLGIGPAAASPQRQNDYLYVSGYMCCAARQASNIFVHQIDNQADASDSQVVCVQEHVYPNWPSTSGSFFDMYKCAASDVSHSLNGLNVDQAYCWVNGGTTYLSCFEEYYYGPASHRITASRGRQQALSPAQPKATGAAALAASDVTLVSKAIMSLRNTGRSYGADPSRASATTIGPGRAKVWLVPGSSGTCLVNVETRQTTGSTCNDTAAVKAGKLWTLDTMPYGAGGSATRVLLGAAPDGDTSATVSWTGGGTTVVPITSNLYSVPIGAHTGWTSVTLTNRSGSTQTVAGIPHLPTGHAR
jgi:hypothetical protein